MDKELNNIGTLRAGKFKVKKMGDVNYSSILAMESNFLESKKRALEETEDLPFLKNGVRDAKVVNGALQDDSNSEEENQKKEEIKDRVWH